LYEKEIILIGKIMDSRLSLYEEFIMTTTINSIQTSGVRYMVNLLGNLNVVYTSPRCSDAQQGKYNI
jgi:hypothetical protein